MNGEAAFGAQRRLAHSRAEGTSICIAETIFVRTILDNACSQGNLRVAPLLGPQSADRSVMHSKRPSDIG